MTSTSAADSFSKRCFNSDCTDLKSETPRKGWRLQTGEFAELCDRCASAFQEGRFCDTFHLNASGWRNCESCGKRVHCGCIVSVDGFTLLENAGGIECIACARKNVVSGSNSSSPSSLLAHSSLSERFKDNSARGWSLSQLAGLDSVHFRQVPSSFNSAIPQSRVPYEVDFSSGIDKLDVFDRLSTPFLENKKIEDFSERLMNESLKLGARGIRENENSGSERINREEQSSKCLTKSQQPSFGLAVPYTSPDGANGQVGVSSTHLRPNIQSPLTMQFPCNLHNGLDASGEAQVCNGRLRPDGHERHQLFPRYWSRITDQGLHQISGDSNSIITPLFEKMLSASDAGRNGRLVLPKKCAEAYLPPVSQQEGIPLKVQDSKGKEWTFQFRFWPNNNSRMYVLEGVTPCIQNMQLQAGDIVTFSRLEPGGKLVMGFRKAAPTSASEQTELADPTSWSEVDKSGHIAKEALGTKMTVSRKRKNSTLGSKSKHLRVDHEDLIELEVTWEEAQRLMRPPPNHVPGVVVIEGVEFEEYEDSPIIGKPTIFASDNSGEKIQCAQCEDCFKWRWLPSNALLPSRWTCSSNSWDPERSLCSAAQVLTAEQLENLLPHCSPASSKKLKAAKQKPENIDALERLDALANLATLGEGEPLLASSQATTKHHRHRPGCSCIVCIQPPSGKGPKHKATCTCNDCQTMKRHFHTLMLRRKKKQSQKEAETTCKQQQPSLPDKVPNDDPLPCTNAGNSSPNRKKVVGEDSEDDLIIVESSNSEKVVREGSEDDIIIVKSSNSQKVVGEGLEDDLTIVKSSDSQKVAREGSEDDLITVKSSNSQKVVGKGLEDDLTIVKSSDSQKVAREGLEDNLIIVKSSNSPFKGQIDLNIQPEREEELSPSPDSGNMMRLLQDATERYLMQQSMLNFSGSSNSGVTQTHPSGGSEGEKICNSVNPEASHRNTDGDHPAVFSIKTSATG